MRRMGEMMVAHNDDNHHDIGKLFVAMQSLIFMVVWMNVYFPNQCLSQVEHIFGVKAMVPL